ncbi:MAG TPA: NAD-dependent epimerase/dehydratase family protein [Solirubrobacteraceae bacterium]|jgi:nucleoside-diphosphate-sugar epimerase|nr:NAD-dependent epimerase/dehydratase family protein [Solirubrobacteraceae bacterium]
MRIVVTGASGNVGTSVLQVLAQEPAVEEIVGIARRVPRAHFEKTSWRQADVTRDRLEPLFEGAEAVIHLAWLIQPSRDEALTRSVNVRGSERVFEAVANAAVPALVYASSVGAYAPGPPDGGAVNESWPATGVGTSFYSRHKAEVERMLDIFVEEHPDVRTVRLRPALIFKSEAATGIRRLFMGPLLPGALMRPGVLPVLPYPRGLRTQAVHSLDVGNAYRLAAIQPVSGAFNIAADPVLDAAAIGGELGARVLPVPVEVVRRAAWASWKLRLQPTSPGWLDMGMLSPIMDTTRAREELGWEPAFTATEALRGLLDGLRRGAGLPTPPLDPNESGPLRVREFATGVGAGDR